MKKRTGYTVRCMTVLLTMVMLVLLVRIPAKAGDEIGMYFWDGRCIAVAGEKLSFTLDIEEVYPAQTLILKVYNPNGSERNTIACGTHYAADGESDEESGDYYMETFNLSTAGFSSGYYRVELYMNYYTGSIWSGTSCLNDFYIQIIDSSTYGWIFDEKYDTWYYRLGNGYFAEGMIGFDDGSVYAFEPDGFLTGMMMTDEFYYPYGGEELIGYYFDENGLLGTAGWHQAYGGEYWIYLNADGTGHNGWIQSNGKWYHIMAGFMETNTMVPSTDGHLCYVGPNGDMKTGWYQISFEYMDGTVETNWYYFSAAGYMQYGWKQINGSWYYLDTETGIMKTGWQQISGKWYYLGTDGAMRTGWQKVNGAWYLLGSDGSMKTGWQMDGGKWYYLGADGAMKTGWQQIGGVWYYLNNSMVTGWKQIGGTWYYFKSNGAMACSETINIGGTNYSFAASGAWIH